MAKTEKTSTAATQTEAPAASSIDADAPPDQSPDQSSIRSPDTSAPSSQDASTGEANADPARFEQSLAELEALVDRLEQGDLSLEESLATFERGVHLSRSCQQALDTAEQRVRILTDTSNEAASESSAKPIPFEPR
ncbi:exodeoxyribonuclease VII, small subunit [Thiorhodovibrio frisius]|uniref:Exodeoxyribonuclease 7 small subunit n=1 Tax=Thiorhodovibrio frisius TaxID=631362 RepID=H8Z6M1_9GAMM|nr:exodeoxyribonuclease VII, small subunit [Thiorhodovibrio frisius]WPL20313.1 Exodeoxyribonuclease 7 small subunit [Thiorhodovibrio frisius]